MRRTSLLAVAVILAVLPGNLAWGQANLPNNPNAVTVQGPDPTGMLGYPLATVPATGALPWPVAIMSFAASVAVTQGTSPWVIGHNTSLTAHTFTVQGDTFDIDVTGMASLSIDAVTPLFNGLLDFYLINDGGQIYQAFGPQTNSTFNHPDGGYSHTLTQAGGTNNFSYRFDVAGFQTFRVVSTQLSAGAVTLSARTSTASISTVALGSPSSGISSQFLPSCGMWAYGPNGGNNWREICATSGGFTANLNPPSYNLLAVANVPYLWNPTGAGGGQFHVQSEINVYKTSSTAAAGSTALWTPAAGKKFRLMRYMVTVTDQATQAGAGTLTFSLLDGAAGVTGQVHDVFVPALGLVNTGSLYTSGWIDLGNGYLSAAANNVLNINLSAALTAGTVRVICCGTEE